jgi:galactokinase
LRYPIEYQDKIKQQSFNGVNPQALEGSSPSLPTNIDQDTLVQNRLRLESQIEFLNQLSKNQQPSPELITTKLKLMKTVWGKDWGNYEEFEIWAEKGAQDPIPQGLEKTAQFYRLGQ